MNIDVEFKCLRKLRSGPVGKTEWIAPTKKAIDDAEKFVAEHGDAIEILLINAILSNGGVRVHYKHGHKMFRALFYNDGRRTDKEIVDV